MRTEDAAVKRIEESPGEAAYRELVEDHADRVYGIATLIISDPAVALQITIEAFERTWDAIRRDQLLGDPDETVYRAATRAALRRIVRSRGGLRGLLPSTTADDHQITAFGITSAFPPQQHAAIYLAVWAQLGYRLAGLASGVGESRARDLAFSARQEYLEARGVPAGDSALCREAAPLLSARADGETTAPNPRLDAHIASCRGCSETAASYDEFTTMLQSLRIPAAPENLVERALAVPRARPQDRGRRRFLRLLAGPAILTLVLIGGLFIFRGFADPSIGTGVGRTSDLLFALDANGAMLVLDSGSGRELGRLPSGVLSSNGQRVYSVSHVCRDGGCTSTLRMTDTGTASSSPLGRLDGQLHLLGVDEQRGRLYLTDSDGSRLTAFDSSLGQVVATMEAPAGLSGPFGPRGAALVPDGPTLFSIATSSGQAAALTIDLAGMQVVSATRLPESRDGYVAVLPVPNKDRLYAYQLSRSTVYEVDLAAERVTDSATLDPGSGSAPPSAEVDGRGTMALAPDGSTLYVVVPSGGIAVVRADPVQLLDRIAADKTYRAVAVSTDGTLLYMIGDDGSYTVLQSSAGQGPPVRATDVREVLNRRNVGALAILQANAGE